MNEIECEKIERGTYRVTVKGEPVVVAVPIHWVVLAERGLIDEATVAGVAKQAAVEDYFDRHPPVCPR